jgi:hypothetical protein
MLVQSWQLGQVHMKEELTYVNMVLHICGMFPSLEGTCSADKIENKKFSKNN